MEYKALVCNLPITESKLTKLEKSLPPLGLGYICSELQKNGYITQLIDAYNLNLSSDEVIKIIDYQNPDFVIMNVFSINRYIAFDIILKLSQNPTIILGGGVRGLDFSNLEVPNKVIIIEGEGELLIPALLKSNKTDKFQHYIINEQSHYFPQNLSELILDHRFFINDPQINKAGKMESYMIYSRGCIYSCTFCGSSARMTQLKRRTRDIWSLRSELNLLLPTVEHIRFLDDLLIDNSQDISNITQVMSQTSKTWSGMISILSVKKASDQELVNLFCSGCTELYLGIESGSEKTLRLFNKYSDIEGIITNIIRLLKIGINVKIFLIIGAYEENVTDLQKTLSLAQRLVSMNYTGRVRFSPFVYKAYEGTELYNKIRMRENSRFFSPSLNKGIETDKNDRSQFNMINGNFSNCTYEEINHYINQILKLNYL